MASQAGERTEEATPRRKQEARRKGQVARSTDLNGSVALLAVVLGGPYAFGVLGAGSIAGLRSALSSFPTELTGAEIGRFTLSVAGPMLSGLAALIACAMAAGLVANFAQVGFVFSAQALAPSLTRLDPIAGIARLFSARSAVEAVKMLAKSLVFGYLAYSAIHSRWNEILGLSYLTPLAASAVVGGVVRDAAMRVAVAWLLLAAADYIFQRRQMDKTLRMTKDELKREMREQEVSPELRSMQAQRRRKLARSRMMQQVRTADVVVTNPTHYAVAIKYDRSKMHAPLVVAKGQDYLALRIREEADDARVPIVPNPPLARSLYKSCEVGDFVPREMFQAVAEVLAYVYSSLSDLNRKK